MPRKIPLAEMMPGLGGVAPELYELLDGEDTSEILDRSAVLGMPALELAVSLRVPGDTADMSDTDHVPVQVGLKDTGTTTGTLLPSLPCFAVEQDDVEVASRGQGSYEAGSDCLGGGAASVTRSLNSSDSFYLAALSLKTLVEPVCFVDSHYFQQSASHH